MDEAERIVLRRLIDKATRKQVRARTQLDRDIEEFDLGAALALVERPCKTPGCPNLANAQYDRGIFAGLCAEDCMERRRDEARATASNGPVNKWTKESIIEAVKLWAREHGEFPKSSTWQKQRGGSWAEDNRFPAYSTVYNLIGSWVDVLDAAGCPTDVSPERVHVASDGTVSVDGEHGEQKNAAPAPPVTPSDPVGENPSFTDIAEELELTFGDFVLAEERFFSALDRFKKHEMYRHIDSQYDGWAK